MTTKRSDHYDLGFEHCIQGVQKYKFQDPYLQVEYDRGWDDAAEAGERVHLGGPNEPFPDATPRRRPL